MFGLALLSGCAAPPRPSAEELCAWLEENDPGDCATEPCVEVYCNPTCPREESDAPWFARVSPGALELMAIELRDPGASPKWLCTYTPESTTPCDAGERLAWCQENHGFW